MRVALFAFMVSALPMAAVAQAPDFSVEALLERYKFEPADSVLCEQIGIAYTRLNQIGKAAEFFGKAVALNPERIATQKNLATVLWFMGRKSESAAIFSKLEERIPDDPVPQLYLGLGAYERKDMPTAATHFERAGTLATDNPETFGIVLEAYLGTGRLEPASDLLERRVAAGGADAKTYRWLGAAYDKRMLPERAQQAYAQAIGQEPQGEENYLALAGFAIEHANPRFAREVVTQGLQRIPQSAKLSLEMGLAWAIDGNFDNAKKSFAEANANDPGWPMPLLALGITHLQTGQAESAAECFQKAKSVAPKDYRCYYLHAVALLRSQSSQEPGTRATVDSELKRALAIDPQNAQVRVALAKSELAGGQPALAEAELRQAIRIAPSDPGALYNLALVCRRAGKTEEAARLLHNFQELKSQARDDENQFVLILKTVN